MTERLFLHSFNQMIYDSACFKQQIDQQNFCFSFASKTFCSLLKSVTYKQKDDNAIVSPFFGIFFPVFSRHHHSFHQIKKTKQNLNLTLWRGLLCYQFT